MDTKRGRGANGYTKRGGVTKGYTKRGRGADSYTKQRREFENAIKKLLRDKGKFVAMSEYLTEYIC